MPLQNIPQPEILWIHDSLRLHKYDGSYEQLLPGYQDPYVYQNSEGIFDDAKKPTMPYVKWMCEYLDGIGELYFIEIQENGAFVRIGDVTIKPENPPIAIWYAKWRGKGIGGQVMQAVIDRLRSLGFPKISGSEVYRWNTVSQKLHEKLGFIRVRETEDSFIYDLDLQ